MPVLAVPLLLYRRPCGLYLLATHVTSLACLDRLLTPDSGLWMRWAEPSETGLEDARIEVAVSRARDAATRTAHVIARATPHHEDSAWALYTDMERQGLVDLVVFGSPPPDGSLPLLGPLADGSTLAYIHVLACADLTRRSEEYGLPTEPFPQHYLATV